MRCEVCETEFETSLEQLADGLTNKTCPGCEEVQPYSIVGPL